VNDLSAVFRRTGIRLFSLLGVVLIVTFVTFWMLELLPNDPCILSAGTGATEQTLAQCRLDLRLDDNLFVRYFSWLGDLVTGDLGRSYRNGIELTTSLRTALPVTAWLLFYTVLLSLIIAIPLGIWSAYRRDSWVDRIVSTGAFGLLSVPPFILGVVLALIFAVRLQWFDLAGYVSPGEGLIDHWKSLTLPTITLAASVVPVYLRVLRTDVIETLNEDFVSVARAKGLPQWYILTRHVLRPSSFGLITVCGINAAQLLNGAVVVEVIYDLDGVGLLLLNAVFNQDISIVQTLVALIAIWFVLVNTIIDIAYPILDPRIRR
jgi:peptide/nickel transport system permease protein